MESKDHTAEIVGGVEMKDLIANGASFVSKCIPPDENEIEEEEQFAQELHNYLKLECLYGEGAYDGQEPFMVLAEQMEKVLPDGKVKKKIVRQGYGLCPEDSTTVNVHYNAYIQYEAQPFDSTYARKKLYSFEIGKGEVIEGLEIAVRSMKINEKSQFIIDPELAYRGGSLGRIPPDSVVLFEIELLDAHETIKEADPEVPQFSTVYELCKALRVKGNKMVRLKDYQGAIKVYKSAVDKLENVIMENYNEQLKSEELLVGLCTNLLVTCSLAKSPKRGCIFAQKIYEIAKNGTIKVAAKVYFNHAKCVKTFGDFDRARRLLLQAKRIEPNNAEIIKELNELDVASEKHRQHEKNLAEALISS